MTRALGLSVSKWDGLVDYQKAKQAGVSFVIAKASQWVADPRFKENQKNAKEAGLLRGFYHFLDWGLSEIKQADIFVETMGGDWGELPPCMDYEMKNFALYGLNRDQAQGKAWNFVSRVEKLTGKLPMIYAGYYSWIEMGSPAIGWARYPLWEACYSAEIFVRIPPPWKRWEFWQFTGKADGTKYGTQSLDAELNWFNGTEAELQAFANVTPPTHPAICPTCGQEWKP